MQVREPEGLSVKAMMPFVLNMTVSVRAMVLLMVVLSPIAAEAQAPVDSLSDLWSRVRSGKTIYVTDASARELKGVLVKVTDEALTIRVNGQDVAVPAPTVRQVERRGDSLKNGFLIGAAVGAGSAAAAFANCDKTCRGDDALPVAVFVTALTLEFGGIGALIDYAIPGRTVVYRAQSGASLRVAPILLASRRGVQVQISF